jgi:hypothetical protein
MQKIILSWRIIAVKGRVEEPDSAAGVRTMKNITVSVCDEVYHEARVSAARLGSSVSALVMEFLESMTENPHFPLELPESALGPPTPPIYCETVKL